MIQMLTFVLAFAALASIEAQTTTTAPIYVNTFDAALSSPQLSTSQSSYRWTPSVTGKQGVAYLDRKLLNYIDVARHPDNYGRTIGRFGGEVSFELWVQQRDWVAWQRMFDFSVNPVNATTGVVNSGPTSDRVSLESSMSGSSYFQYEISTASTSVTAASTSTTMGRIGEWIHIACTTSNNTAGVQGPLSTTQGFSSFYLNGALVTSSAGYFPRDVIRTVGWLGRSSYVLATDAYFTGFFDSFAMYNYPLSAEAVYAHMKTSRPPQFELTFSKNPASITGTTAPAYSWIATSGTRIAGAVVLSGSSQSIDLLASSGASSSGYVLPSLNGVSGGQPTTPGWSYTATVNLNTFTGSPIFDFKDASVNRMRMYITTTGNVVFELNGRSVTSSTTISVGTWYHLAATISSTGTIKLYINNAFVGTSTGTAATAVTYTSAFLGRSTDTVPMYTNGMIDSFRVYDIEFSADEVSGLHSTIVAAPTGLATTPRLSPPAQSAPIVSYTFNSPPGEFGSAGLTNYTWLPSRTDHSGMASFDGSNHAIYLRDMADDYNVYPPDMFGGAMSFEINYQYADSLSQSMLFSLSGPRGPADNNILLFNTINGVAGFINSLSAQVYGFSGSASTYNCNGCNNGSWIHAILSIAQVNPLINNTATSSQISLFVNGLLVSQGTGWLPALTYRNNLILGRSPWDGDQLFNGNIDSVFFYNTEMSAEAVAAHYILPLPPVYEAVFASNPAVQVGGPGTAANYGWVVNDTSRQGFLSLTGTQFVDLTASTGVNSIVQTLPMIGTGRNTPGVSASIADGLSFHILFNPTSVAAGLTLFDIASAGGANSLSLAFAATGLIFTHAGATLNCGIIPVNQWSDVQITINEDGASFDGQCYVNGLRVAAVPNFPRVPYVARTVVFLGKSSTVANSNFQGWIDQFRVMSYALSSEDAQELYLVGTRYDRFADAAPYQSGPSLAHTFDVAPLPFADPSTSTSYNYFNWQERGNAADYFNHPDHTGLAVFAAAGNSYALRNYIDANFDPDAYGRTMPLVYGGSMSFEVLINLASPLRPTQKIFDFADNLANNNNAGNGAGQFDILMGCSDVNDLRLASHYLVGSVNRGDIVGGFNPTKWQHITAVINATSATTATFSLYLDGKLNLTFAGVPPPVRTRRSAFIGRSNYDDQALAAAIDSFYWFNYALTPAQIQQHFVLPNPATFDASFESHPAANPSIATYGWAASNTFDATHKGELTFNGVNQWVDLNSGKSNSSIGQNFPTVNGLTIGVNQAGFSIEISCRWASLVGSSKVLDLGNGNGVDSIAIGNQGSIIQLYVNNGLTDESSAVPLFTATVNTYYHFIIVATPVFNSTLMNYGLYHGGNLVLNVTNQVAPPMLARRRAWIGRSNTVGDSLFSGSIDLIRYYSYYVKPTSAQYLATQSGNSGVYVAAGPVPAISSSSTGQQQVISSSAASSSARSSSTSSASISSSSLASSSSVPASSSVNPSSSSSTISSSSAISSSASVSSSAQSSSARSSSSAFSSSQVSSSAISSSAASVSSSVASVSSSAASVSSSARSSSAVSSSTAAASVTSTLSSTVVPSSTDTPSTQSSSSHVSTVSSSSADSFVEPDSSSSSSLSDGAIAGIVVGVFVGVGLCLCLVFFLFCGFCRGKDRKFSNVNNTNPSNHGSEDHSDAEVELQDV